MQANNEMDKHALFLHNPITTEDIHWQNLDVSVTKELEQIKNISGSKKAKT